MNNVLLRGEAIPRRWFQVIPVTTNVYDLQLLLGLGNDSWRSNKKEKEKKSGSLELALDFSALITQHYLRLKGSVKITKIIF